MRTISFTEIVAFVIWFVVHTSAVRYFNILNQHECELNIDYEYLLEPISNDIKNRYQTQISPKTCLIFQLPSCNILKFMKKVADLVRLGRYLDDFL